MPNSLYKVTGYSPTMREMYEVRVLAKDAKHAERLVRWTYAWELRKAKLTTVAMDMEQEQIVSERKWYEW